MQTEGKFYVWLNIASTTNYFWSQPAQDWSAHADRRHVLRHPRGSPGRGPLRPGQLRRAWCRRGARHAGHPRPARWPHLGCQPAVRRRAPHHLRPGPGGLRPAIPEPSIHAQPEGSVLPGGRRTQDRYEASLAAQAIDSMSRNYQGQPWKAARPRLPADGVPSAAPALQTLQHGAQRPARGPRGQPVGSWRPCQLPARRAWRHHRPGLLAHAARPAGRLTRSSLCYTSGPGNSARAEPNRSKQCAPS